jgi:hypothetical protein
MGIIATRAAVDGSLSSSPPRVRGRGPVRHVRGEIGLAREGPEGEGVVEGKPGTGKGHAVGKTATTCVVALRSSQSKHDLDLTTFINRSCFRP